MSAWLGDYHEYWRDRQSADSQARDGYMRALLHAYLPVYVQLRMAGYARKQEKVLAKQSKEDR